ncbi:transcriptional regulator [Candidatus Poribacteria bacterium]|nr:transcriptional regulator [Candidatus Poribacteria bacterium]
MSKESDIRWKFGRRVRAIRRAQDMSQEAFAHLCELDRSYISGVERGKRNVSLVNIERLAKALGVPISELTDGL